ncbi:MAG: FlgD immunoglobulin-like domain containing protein [Pseudomonadota bacterium]
MARLLPIALVVALLVGSAVAFAVTERLKLVRSPIAAPKIDKTFSPVCRCPKERARIRFRLRTADRVDLAIVDGDGDVVRTLFTGRQFPVGTVAATWDGRDDDGRIVPEGAYRPRVHLDRERRTIALPNPIRVDTTPPTIRLTALRPPDAFSPDGDGRNDKVRISYAIDEPANALLWVDGDRVVRTRFAPTEGKLEWFGIRDGKALPRGRYRLELRAEDKAGNVGPPVRSAIRIRYIDLARELVRVPPRVRFGIGVDTDARAYRWRLAGRSGTARGPLLVLRAPGRPGRYTLFVEANGRADRAAVVVRAR